MDKAKKAFDLLEEVKNIELFLPKKRQNIYNNIKNEFPSIKYKNFNGLQTGLRHGKLPQNIAKKLVLEIKEIDSLKEKVNSYTKKAYQLRVECSNDDVRKKLNPSIDIIPKDGYQKLKDCDIYQLRKSCNYGENETSIWARCEYMKYNNSNTGLDSNRWFCAYNDDKNT